MLVKHGVCVLQKRERIEKRSNYEAENRTEERKKKKISHGGPFMTNHPI